MQQVRPPARLGGLRGGRRTSPTHGTAPSEGPFAESSGGPSRAFYRRRVSTDLIVTIVVAVVGIALLSLAAVRITRMSRAIRAAGRPRPRAVVVFWVAYVVALVGCVAFVVAAALGVG